MILDEYTSIKIRWISFVALLCVTLGHSSLQATIVHLLFCQWHVPWFLLCSGMMLMLSLHRHGRVDVVRKKIVTLLLPYFLWCVIGAIISFPHSTFHMDWSGIFGLNTCFPNGNLNLWYLHSLIIFVSVGVVLGPLLFGGVIRKCCGIALFAIVFMTSIKFNMSILYGTPASPFYFFAGMVLAPYILGDNQSSPKNVAFIFTIALSSHIFLRCLWCFSPNVIVKTFAVVAQMASVWFGYDLLLKEVRFTHVQYPFLKMVFFVYCFHGPLMLYAKEAWILLFGGSASSCVCGMWIIWVFVTAISFLTAFLIKKYLNRFYCLLSGGR